MIKSYHGVSDESHLGYVCLLFVRMTDSKVDNKDILSTRQLIDGNAILIRGYHTVQVQQVAA